MNFFLENSNFSSNFIFSHTAQFLSKINNFFSSESWNIILYCRQIHLVNAPIFWRVSSFEVLLTNKKIAFWNQIQKLARFSSLWVGWSFWHYHCKERPIFDLGLAWFAFITRKTTSTKKKIDVLQSRPSAGGHKILNFTSKMLNFSTTGYFPF